MPDVTVEIGGRNFIVACQDGEEAYLQSAAALLDREAQTLVASGARLTQERMLLMAGLMLADKSISAEEDLKAVESKLASQAAVIDELQDRPAPTPVTQIPEGLSNRLTDLAEKAEALAAKAGT